MKNDITIKYFDREGTEHDITNSAVYPVHLSKTINGDKNGGGFEVYNMIKDPLPAYTKCEITINGETSFWYLEDEVVQNKAIQEKFKHIISLIDPLQRLQGFYMADLKFTQPLQRSLVSKSDIYTYKTAIERVFAVTPLRVSNPGMKTDPLFKLDPDIEDRLDAIEFPESFPRGKNLLEFVFQVGSYLAAVPYMKDYNTLSFTFLNDENEGIDVTSFKYENYRARKKASSYCTDIDTTMDNIMPESDASQASIVEPINYGWMTIRPINATRLEDDNWGLELKYGIKEIKSIQLSFHDNYHTIDIVSRVLESAKYHLLDVEEKQKYLYYELGKNTIEGIRYNYKILGYWSSKTAIKQIVLDLYFEQFGLHLNPIIDGILTEREIKYRVEYIPYTDNVRAKIVRNNNSDYSLEHSFCANQTDSIISSQAYGKYLQNHIERLGQEERVYVTAYAKFEDIPKIGQYLQENNEKYYLTSLNINIEGGFIITEQVFNKNYEAVSEKIGLNAVPRQFELRKGNIRSDVYTEFCELSYTFDHESTCFDGKQLLLGVLSDWKHQQGAVLAELLEIFRTKITTVIGQTYKSENSSMPLEAQWPHFLLPAISNAFGKSLLFNTKFPGPFSVGRYIEGSTITTTNDACNLPYTEKLDSGVNLGRFTSIVIDFYNIFNKEIDLQDAEKLPIISVNEYDPWWGGLDSLSLIHINNLIYYKNGDEIPSITYQLQIDSADKDIIVGERFLQGNPLVTNYEREYIEIAEENKYLRIYGTYGQYSGGSYLKVGEGYYLIREGRRYSYNEYTSEWEQNNEGNYLAVSRDIRFVYLTNKIISGAIKPIGPNKVINLNVNATETDMDPETGNWLPNIWFGDDISQVPEFDNSSEIGTHVGWAILDEQDRIILGCNKQDFNPIYVNFKRSKWQ